MAGRALSIIIITLNEAQRLPRLLDDLAAQSWTDFEIIHVDSRSEDDTVRLSRAHAAIFPRYRIIEMPERGVSLGRNTGAAVAEGRRLLFLDADTRLHRDFLHQCHHELEVRPEGVGIVLMSAEGLAVRYRLGFGLFNLGIRATSLFFRTAIGACLFSTPALHEAIDGFDAQITLCEDCNYALKAFRRDRAHVAILRPRFRFDPRRLEQDGFAATGWTYLRANLRRFFRGEMRDREIPYRFGHYE